MTDPVDLEQAEREARSEPDAQAAEVAQDAKDAEDVGAAEDAQVELQELLDDGDGVTPTSSEYSIAFSPRNVAVGLAIVAGVIGLILRRRRGTGR